MNSAALAQTAYKKATAIAPSERTVEYRAFAQVTGKLSNAHNSDSPTAFRDLCEAVHLNRRLWSILAIDVANDDNALPQALRAQIVSLAGFVWKHSSKVLRKEEGPEALIEINTSIMRGLRGAKSGD